jgi:hypothetical protein
MQDILSFAFCLAGFFGNTVVWRGRRYYLHSDGRLELRAKPADPPVIPTDVCR